MEPFPKAFDLDTWILRWAAREVSSLDPPVGSANAHYHVRREGGDEWFLKVYDQQRHCHREVTSYDLLVNRLNTVSAPPLLAHGEINGRPWAAFEWRSDLKQVSGDSLDQVALLAETIAAIHDVPVPPGLDLPSMPRIWSDIILRTRRMSQLSASFADRVERLIEPISTACQHFLDEVEPSQQLVLLHGDVAFRNLFESNGAVFLGDLERAAVGMADFDFAKLWDGDLGTTTRRRHFAAVYRQARTTLPPQWPDDRLGWVVRLWAALGIVPYAERIGDMPFRAFADEMLTTLSVEAASLWDPE